MAFHLLNVSWHEVGATIDISIDVLTINKIVDSSLEERNESTGF